MRHNNLESHFSFFYYLFIIAAADDELVLFVELYLVCFYFVIA